MACPDPEPGIAPGLRPCPSQACSRSPPLSSPLPFSTQGTRFQPSLATPRVPAARLCRSGSAFWTPTLRGVDEDLCALVMPDSLNAITGVQCVAFVDWLCCCRWTLPGQPPPTVDSAVISQISCHAQAPQGPLLPASLRPASRRLNLGSSAPESTVRKPADLDLTSCYDLKCLSPSHCT